MELKACIYSTFLLHSHSYHPITKPRYFSSFAYNKFIIRTNGHFTDDNNIYDNNFIGIYKYTLNELQKGRGSGGRGNDEVKMDEMKAINENILTRIMNYAHLCSEPSECTIM